MYKHTTGILIMAVLAMLIFFSCPTTTTTTTTTTTPPGPSGSPEMNIQDGSSVDIADGAANINIGSIVQLTSSVTTFTIQNTGTSNLVMTGSPLVTLTGDAEFSLTTDATTPVAAGGSTTFQVTFSPTVPGTFTSDITVANNDSDENPYNFTIQGVSTATPEPEIAVQEGTTNIADGSSNYDIGTRIVGDHSIISFTVKNEGAASLTLSGLSVTGSGYTQEQDFGSTTLLPAETTTFEVRYTPTTAGATTGTITFTNNDGDENPFNFTIQGTGLDCEMNVKESSNNIADGSANYSFGSVQELNSTTLTFTIQNIGTANLNLTGSPAVTLTGTGFSLDLDATGPIAASGTTTFIVKFSPTSAGAYSGNISIANNDGNENPYNFTIVGTGTATPVPEINVMEGINNIADGASNYDAGSTNVGTPMDIDFAVQNTGTATLNLTGTPRASLTGDAEFSLTQDAASTVAASSVTTFRIHFNPTVAGTYSGSIVINNNDNNENPYNFTFTATANGSEMNIMEGSSNIADGSSGYNIGSTQTGNNKDVTFTIQNTGNASLSLSDSPRVTLTGNSAFTLQTDAASSVAASGTTTFVIRMNSSSVGTYNANISIANNDFNENPYTFSITGSTTAIPVPVMSVSQSGNNIADGASGYDTGSTNAGTPKNITFTIDNTGTAALNLSGSPRVTLTGDSEFTLQTDAAASVATSGSTTFVVRFNPGSAGTYNGSISIVNNDSTKNPFNFTFTCTAISPEINVKKGLTDIADGGSTNLGSTNAGTPLDVTFTIENTGSDDLNLTGTPIVTLTGDGEFTLHQDAVTPVIAGNTTTFVIRLSSSAFGTYNGNISIANSDLNENPYNFSITGTVLAPEINVMEGSNNIADGSSGYSLGSVNVSTNNDVVFTIQNTGNSTLNLTGTPRVTVSGSGYSLLSDAATTVASSGSTTFTLRFNSATPGSYNGSISIANNDSDENPYNFTVSTTVTGQVPTPTFNPAAGTYTSAQSVTISCTDGAATIHYTTNGSTPTTSDSVYSSPISVPTNTTMTIKAIAVNSGWTDSAVATAVYTVTGTIATPTFSPVAGTFTTSQDVSISCSTGSSTIYYTIDGSTPTTSSSTYSGTINVPLNTTMTIKALAVKAGWVDSSVASATFTVVSYKTVTYDGNGNTSGSIPVDGNTYVSGNSVTVLGNTGSLTKAGSSFVGWCVNADGSGTSYTPGNTFTMGTTDVILYAEWTALPTYDVTYVGNGNTGGTAPVDGTSYIVGSNVTVLGNTGGLVKTGSSFIGWDDLASGSTYSPGNQFVIDGNITLTAKWSVNPTYTITYFGNSNTGGSVPTDSTNYENGSLVTVMANTGNLTKTANNFTGWNTAANGSGTSYSGGSTFNMGSANVSLYAQWSAMSTYTMTYNSNGSTGGSVPVDGSNYLTGASVTVLANTGSLVRTGYAFTGWNTLANGTGTTYNIAQTFAMGSSNMTLYAIWTADSASSWADLHSASLPYGAYDAVATSADGAYVFAIINSTSGTTGIYRSTNSGTTWARTYATGRAFRCVASSSTGQYVIAGVSTGNIFVSTDYGATWTSRASSLAWRGVTMSSDGTKMYGLVNGGGVWRSTNYGTNWTQVNTTSRAYYAASVSSDGTTLAAIVNNGGIYVSTDSGTTMTLKLSKAAAWRGVSISSNGQIIAGVIQAGTYPNSGVWVCNDPTKAFTTWTQTDTNSVSYRCIAMSSDGSKMGVGVKGTTGGYVSFSSNYGVNWYNRTYTGMLVWTGIATSSTGARFYITNSSGGSGGSVWVYTQ